MVKIRILTIGLVLGFLVLELVFQSYSGLYQVSYFPANMH